MYVFALSKIWLGKIYVYVNQVAVSTVILVWLLLKTLCIFVLYIIKFKLLYIWYFLHFQNFLKAHVYGSFKIKIILTKHKIFDKIIFALAIHPTDSKICYFAYSSFLLIYALKMVHMCTGISKIIRKTEFDHGKSHKTNQLFNF